MKTAALVAAIVLAQPDTSPSLETLLDRLSAYLVQYEHAISEVMADEEMTQDVRSMSTRAEPRRRLKSEMAFMRLPGDGPWIGYRVVYEVNGRSVTAPRDRLHALLKGGADQRERGVAIARESARHNVGYARTTNVPLLAFELIHPRNRSRFTFKKAGVERVSGHRARRVDFVEHASPTVILTPTGYDLPSRGSIWMDENNGRVFQSEVRERDGLGSARLLVTFVEHAGLGILVPERMREVFPTGAGLGDGTARYSNFRRFSTSGRIVPQQYARLESATTPSWQSWPDSPFRRLITVSRYLRHGRRKHVTAGCDGPRGDDPIACARTRDADRSGARGWKWCARGGRAGACHAGADRASGRWKNGCPGSPAHDDH